MVLSTINPSSFDVRSSGIIGAMEASSYISLVLYGILLLQGYTYCRNRQCDRLSLRLLVYAVLFLETCHSITAPLHVYENTVINWQEPEANSYALATNVLLESLVTLIVQCYFMYRVYVLSGNFLIIIVCSVFVSLRFIGGIFLTVESYRDVPNRPNGIGLVVTFSWLITTALALGGAADVLIAMCLTYYLSKMLSPDMEATTNIINRLIRWILQTGLLTSLASVSVIICFQTFKNMVWFSLYIILAKLYSNSLFASLNARPLRGRGEKSTSIRFETPITISGFPVDSDSVLDRNEFMENKERITQKSSSEIV